MSDMNMNQGNRGEIGSKKYNEGSRNSQNGQERGDQSSNNGRDYRQCRSRGRDIKCQFCDKNGLVASTCYKLKNLISSNSRGSIFFNSKSSPSTYVVTSIASDSNSDNAWIIGIDATHHLTHNASNFGNPTHFLDNKGVIIGNRVSIPIFCSSNVVLD